MRTLHISQAFNMVTAIQQLWYIEWYTKAELMFHLVKN